MIFRTHRRLLKCRTSKNVSGVYIGALVQQKSTHTFLGAWAILPCCGPDERRATFFPADDPPVAECVGFRFDVCARVEEEFCDAEEAVFGCEGQSCHALIFFRPLAFGALAQQEGGVDVVTTARGLQELSLQAHFLFRKEAALA